MKRIDQILNGLIRLSGKIVGQEPWLRERVEEGVGNIAQLEVHDIEGRYSRRLELTPDLKIVDSKKTPIHRIRVHTDTFLGLLSDEIDFGTAYAEGQIDFEGKDYHLHALKWSRAFQRIRGYLRGLK